MRSPSQPENHMPQDALGSTFTKKRPPMLRLASPDDEFSKSMWAGTKLDTIPGSPPVTADMDSFQSTALSDAFGGDSTDHLLSPMRSPASPITTSVSRSYTLPVPRRRTVPALFIDAPEPAFRVTSEAATRRLKMERIRKRLGECVPVEAVFPHESSDGEGEDGDYVQVIVEKKPAQVNVDVRPRWKSSSAVVAFDVIYECPDEHGDEGLVNGLSLPSRTPKNRIFMGPRSSNTAPPRRWGKLVKRTGRVSCS
ncbi:hypothetical protein BDM02DRAFT_3108779 [Thelephora ganbajun]|uniref:Uncharacterized protein n=1 Tax=Thelephora ganbajun TaxID=370292 RepID=A0ACB6ZTA2_THEGA|nr:hypothetical protein BDM02DRAFT_3108779 [Thelephora ganbajun]